MQDDGTALTFTDLDWGGEARTPGNGVEGGRVALQGQVCPYGSLSPVSSHIHRTTAAGRHRSQVASWLFQLQICSWMTVCNRGCSGQASLRT